MAAHLLLTLVFRLSACSPKYITPRSRLAAGLISILSYVCLEKLQKCVTNVYAMNVRMWHAHNAAGRVIDSDRSSQRTGLEQTKRKIGSSRQMLSVSDCLSMQVKSRWIWIQNPWIFLLLLFFKPINLATYPYVLPFYLRPSTRDWNINNPNIRNPNREQKEPKSTSCLSGDRHRGWR